MLKIIVNSNNKSSSKRTIRGLELILNGAGKPAAEVKTTVSVIV